MVRRGMTSGKPDSKSTQSGDADAKAEANAKGTQDSPNAHKNQIPASEEPPTQNPVRGDTHKPGREHPEAKVARPDEHGFFDRWGRLQYAIRKPLAEWLGTTVSVTLRLCAGFSTFASQNQAGTFGGFVYDLAIFTGGESPIDQLPAPPSPARLAAQAEEHVASAASGAAQDP